MRAIARSEGRFGKECQRPVGPRPLHCAKESTRMQSRPLYEGIAVSIMRIKHLHCR